MNYAYIRVVYGAADRKKKHEIKSIEMNIIDDAELCSVCSVLCVSSLV